MNVEPTEEINLNHVSAPYLKNGFAKAQDLADDDRFDSMRHLDKTTISVSPSTYVMRFIATEPSGIGGVQYFVHPDKIRSGAREGLPNPVEASKAVTESKRERIQDKLIRNNIWMKDISRDDVDARKGAFKKDLEEPKVVKDDEDDVDMVES
jgi:paired amphipathic helix protein Sin3a